MEKGAWSPGIPAWKKNFSRTEERGRKAAPNTKKRGHKLKLLIAFAVLLLVGLGAAFAPSASDASDKAIEDQLTDNIAKQLEGIDFAPFEQFLSSLSGDEYKLFGAGNFNEKLQSVLSGSFADGYESAFSAILHLIAGETLNFGPTLAGVIVVALLAGILSHMRPNFLSKGMGEVIYFVCYAVVIVIMLNSVIQLMDVARGAMDMMKGQMNAIFPVLLTLMTGIGGVVSVKVYQPAVAVLAGLVLNVITAVIFPLFLVSCVLGICSNLSGSVKLDRLVGFFKSASNWIIGITFTVFLAFLSIQGITAATHDGISIRAAKYAVSNSIPVLGGYIKDGFDLVVSGTVLVKNAFGVTGLALLISTMALPFLKLVLFMMGLKLASAIVEPVTDSRIAGFIGDIGKNMTMLIVSMVGVAFMYFITVMLLICSSNFI